MPLTFITGPVRSGKSRLAIKLARAHEQHGLRVTYVATATLGEDDAEWQARIEHHREQRDPAWAVVETAAASAPPFATVVGDAQRSDVLIVDSTATWLAARIDALLQAQASIDLASLERESAAFAQACERSAAHVIVVGDEIGWSPVPDSASMRLFRDVLGRMHQRLTGASERAFLVVAGRAIDLYEAGTAI